MRADQREARDTMIEGSRVPAGGGVARGAICNRECRTRRRVDWVVRLLPGREVALRIAAISRADFQRVVAVDVALVALHRCVLVRERKAGGAVVEFAIGPGRDWVARRAGSSRGWKACSDVIRNVATNRGCALPSRRVAAHAIC